MIRVGTIRQIHRVLIDAGYQISENALRQWIKQGVIPAVYSGAVAYVAYDAVVAFLTAPKMPA